MSEMPLLRPTYAGMNLKALADNLLKARAELSARGRCDCNVLLHV